jgi:TRAP-type C4-dicarboxylate transport system permease small subunit
MRRALARVAAGWALCGGALLLAVMVVTTLNALGFAGDRVARLVGMSLPGLPGYEDFVRLCVAMAALMFLPFCQSERGHIAVDLFATGMTSTVRGALDRFWLIATALLALFLAYWMTAGLIESRSDGAVTPVLGWPVWRSFAPGIASLLLWAAVAIVQLGDDAASIRAASADGGGDV